MKAKQLVLLILAVFTSFPAWANVVYTWKTLAPSETITSFASEIVVTDAAYFRGSASVDYSCLSCVPGNNDGILSISFSSMKINVLRYPATGFLIDLITFDFTHPGFLRGNYYINTLFEDMGMSSTGDVWTVNTLNSDNDVTVCFNSGFCHGITGYYQADSLPVPEPMSLPLIGLGLAVLFGLRRFKKKS